ncbi:MAG TPA: transposase, partial [Isosphaeraceae bacterium]|nr:transposase [Isosphaeraceae bacterium]
WPSATLISMLRLSGVGASWAFAGATDPAAFRTAVQNRRVPPLRPGDVVRWDKLKPPPDAEGRQAVEQAGVPLASWPPYSSDLTPIEKRWSKVKEPLRAVAARAIGVLDGAMGDALREVNL